MTDPTVTYAIAVQARILAAALIALVLNAAAAPHTSAVRLAVVLEFFVTLATAVVVRAAIGGACAVGARCSVAVALAARVLDAHGLAIGGLIALGLPQQ